MKTYWVVRENGIVVAAMAENQSSHESRRQLLDDIMEFAESGPVERIRTDERIMLGGTIKNFVRPKA